MTDPTPPNQSPASPPTVMLSLALLAGSLSACGVFVDHRPQSRFIGPVSPTTNAENCPATRGILTMRQNLVSFAPDEGTWVLDGIAGPKTLTATRSQPGTDHKLYKTELQAQWTDTEIHGTYTTPRCTYKVDLTAF